MKEIDEAALESTLANQIPEADSVVTEAPAATESMIGKKIAAGGRMFASDEQRQEMNDLVEEKHLSRKGENIFEKASIRAGWIEVDKALFNGREVFYPDSWRMFIRPAQVDAIKNWSTIDDENPNSVDDVFNEIIKNCFMIVDGSGKPIPWGKLNSWDRFYIILLIRQYTMIKGEKNIEYTEDCPGCDNPVTFTLVSEALDFELPDQEVMPYYNRDSRMWEIDPYEFDVEGQDMIRLYVPTLQKDANIKSWIISRIQNKKKVDQVFIKFLNWMAPEIPSDPTLAERTIRQYEMQYKAWDEEMFSLMNDILNNINVKPSTKLVTTCPICGEEVTSEIRFPDGISSLFNVANRHKKFGKK